MARLFLICLAIFVPLSAYSQTGSNIFVGYSYLNADAANRSSLNGWDGSLEGKIFPFIGIVADLSGHYGNEDVGSCGPGCSIKANAHQHNFLLGPRVSVSVGKIRPFAHYLVGASHVSFNANLGSDTSFAHAIGGGFDIKPVPLIGWRFQGDFLQTRFFSTTQNDFRLSTGIVLHF